MHYTRAIVVSLTLVACIHLARSEDHHKRAPSGFTGVRGKKSSSGESLIYEEGADDLDGNNNNLPVYESPFPAVGDLNKRMSAMSVLGFRGKKPREAYNRWDGMKRAPNGFFGMRGKKDDPDVYSQEKRTNSRFFGMRGKKDDVPLYYKRAASMGFVGMRGRRDFDDALSKEFEKRAPSGFFGMRGKKEWLAYTTRGKKFPYNFRDKFVGVRGKKATIGDDNREMDMNQLMVQLLEDATSQTNASGV